MKLPPTPDGKVWYTRLDGSHVQLTPAQRLAVLRNLEEQGLPQPPQAEQAALDTAEPPLHDDPEVAAIMAEPAFRELLAARGGDQAGGEEEEDPRVDAALGAIRDDPQLQAKLLKLAQAGAFSGEAAAVGSPKPPAPPSPPLQQPPLKQQQQAWSLGDSAAAVEQAVQQVAASADGETQPPSNGAVEPTLAMGLALLDAIDKGDIAGVKAALVVGATLTQKLTGGGSNALHNAAFEGQVQDRPTFVIDFDHLKSLWSW